MNTGIMMLVIAGTRQGKTTKVKKIIGSNAPCLIYDVNGEYGDIIPGTDTGERRSRFFSKDVNDFLQIVGILLHRLFLKQILLDQLSY